MMNRSLLLIGSVMYLSLGSVHAEPIDTWDLTKGIDCLGDRFNPINAEGTRDPAGEPLPNTPEWIARDAERRECDNQRDEDRRYHPAVYTAHSLATYGQDFYRRPEINNNVRFRYNYLPAGELSGLGYGVPDTGGIEIYRPCAAGSCPNLPAVLERHEPPYPVVLIWHGAIAQMGHHRFNAQTFAEAGYMAILINGTAANGAPNFPNAAHGGAILDWLATPDSTVFGAEVDLDRVAFSGHSAGAGAAASWQGDPRIDAFVAWDSDSLGDSVANNNCAAPGGPCQPIMYLRTDGAFSAPQATARTDYPANRNRGLSPYTIHKNRGMDVIHITFRATNHIDWNGNGIGGLAGNRYAESLINYYSLAWLDRHVKGKLNIKDGQVETSNMRTEAEERAFRQEIAQDAFNRITALRFPAGSIDKFNISAGFWDPVKAISSGDPVIGGNVPYSIEGLYVSDRLSPEFRNLCRVTVPNYVAGSSGVPNDPVPPKRVADTTIDGDMRFIGCPEIQQVVDTDGDGVLDDVDDCVNEPGPASNNGCPIVTDTTPDAFSFTSLSGVAQGSVVSSNVVTISGIDAPSPVSISTGEYRINGGGWTSAAGSITNGQTVQVRHTSANAPGTTVESVLTIGGVQGKFRSTTAGTAGNDTDPDAFSFGSKTNQAPSTVVVSDAITLTGYDAPAPVTAGSGTQYSLGCTQDNWTSAPGTLAVGQSLCVRHTTASGSNALRKTSLKVGTVVGYFTTRTAP
jgi:dienelactone hydrolase